MVIQTIYLCHYTTMNAEPRYILGFDIETGGPIIGKHPLLAVGMCMYYYKPLKTSLSSNQELIYSIEVHIDAPLSSYDDATKRDFWEKNPEAWAKIRSATRSPEEAAYLLIEFIKKCQKKAIDDAIPLYTVTDNCWFDDTWLSSFLCGYGGNPIRHNYYTGFTPHPLMVDLNSLVNGYAYSGQKKPFLKTKTQHDHTPLSDAMNITERYMCFLDKTIYI